MSEIKINIETKGLDCLNDKVAKINNSINDLKTLIAEISNAKIEIILKPE